MASHGVVYDRVEGIVAKLYVLRDSCTGIIHTERSNPNQMWFQGAEKILQEAVDQLQGVLQVLETGVEGEPAIPEEEEVEAPSEVDEGEEEAPDEETE